MWKKPLIDCKNKAPR